MSIISTDTCLETLSPQVGRNEIRCLTLQQANGFTSTVNRCTVLLESEHVARL